MKEKKDEGERWNMTRNGCTRQRWEQKQFEPNRCNTAKKQKKHGPLSFARPSSRCLPKIFSFTSLFFSFHRLLLAHRGKRNGFCHYIDIMTIYTSIRKWWRYSYLSTYGPALFFFIPRIHFHLFISLAESLYTPPCRPFSLSFSLSFSLFKKWLVQRVYRPVRVMSAKSTSDRA